MSYVPPDGDTASESVKGISPVDSIEFTEHHTNVHISKGDIPFGNLHYTSAPDAPVLVIGGPRQQTDYINMEADWRDEENDEQVDDNKTIISSILTADGIHDMTGFSIVCFVILIGDMSRGVMWPTLWPLVSELGGTTVTLGYAVAAFSFGRIIVSPLFGHWSVLYGYSKVLLMSCALLFLGTLLYAQAQNVGSPSFLILAQSVLGIGSGTLGVTRAFVAEVTATRTRTRYMMWITAVQYGGFTVTPFFGALFIKILGDNDYQFGYVERVCCVHGIKLPNVSQFPSTVCFGSTCIRLRPISWALFASLPWHSLPFSFRIARGSRLLAIKRNQNVAMPLTTLPCKPL